MSPSRNRPLCLCCRSAVAGFLWRTASHLLKLRLRLAYRPETNDSGVASLAVIGSLWQRIALSIQASLMLAFIGAISFVGDSMSPSRNRPLCLCCRSAVAGFLWRTASHLLKLRLRLAYRPETNDSGVASLAVIGSLWQRIALSIQASLMLAFIGAISFVGDSMSPSRNRPLCLRCRSAVAGFLWRTASLLLKLRLRLAYRPETNDSGVASLAVIGSLWQRIALSIQASLMLAFIGAISFVGDSMSPSRNRPLCLRCRSAVAGFLWRTASLLLRLRLRSSSLETACRSRPRPITLRLRLGFLGVPCGLRLFYSSFDFVSLS